jgi:hypothetical protein
MQPLFSTWTIVNRRPLGAFCHTKTPCRRYGCLKSSYQHASLCGTRESSCKEPHHISERQLRLLDPEQPGELHLNAPDPDHDLPRHGRRAILLLGAAAVFQTWTSNITFSASLAATLQVRLFHPQSASNNTPRFMRWPHHTGPPNQPGKQLSAPLAKLPSGRPLGHRNYLIADRNSP